MKSFNSEIITVANFYKERRIHHTNDKLHFYEIELANDMILGLNEQSNLCAKYAITSDEKFLMTRDLLQFIFTDKYVYFLETEDKFEFAYDESNKVFEEKASQGATIILDTLVVKRSVCR